MTTKEFFIWVYAWIVSTIGAIANLAVKIAGLFVVPIALLFVQGSHRFNKGTTNQDPYRLPDWAWWFDNYDDGLDGPEWWDDKYTDSKVLKYFWDSAYFRRFWWNAIRNGCHNFGERVVGFHASKAQIIYDNGQRPSDWSGISGRQVMLAKVDGFPVWAPMIKYVHVYKDGKHCFEWLWGWKLWEVDPIDPDDPWVNIGGRPPHPWRKTKPASER